MSQRRLLLQNSNSNEFVRDEVKENGKARCFICKSDICDDDGRAEDIFSYNYKNKKICLSESAKGVSLTLKSPSTLIMPCKCEAAAHIICMRRYIVYNLQYRCDKCKSYYNIEYENTSSILTHLVNIFIITFLIALLFGIYGLAIVILFDVLFFEYILFHWKYIVFILLIILNKILILITIKIFKSIRYDRKLFVSGYMLIESESVPTFYKIRDFSRYLEMKYYCGKSQLMERKVEIFNKQNIDKNKINISKFIREYNYNSYGEISNMVNRKKHNSNTRVPNAKGKKNDRFATKLAMIDEKTENKNNADKSVELNSIIDYILENENIEGDNPIEKMLQMQINRKSIKKLPSKPNLESKLQKPDTSNFNCDSIIE
jgi:hypothetical protein